MFCHARSMNFRFLLFPWAFTVGAILSPASNAADAITIKKLATFDANLSVPVEIRLNCDLEKRIPAYTRDHAKEGFSQVILSEDLSGSTTPLTLTMTIVGLRGQEGGLQTGGKHVVIEGALRENGKLKGSFLAKRRAGVTWGPAHKGTCSLLDRCAQALGKDVAAWLLAPSLNARLGDEI